jgi:hypothetical protein
MQDHDQKPIQGWKAASIMLGTVGFVLLATWVMVSNDRSHSVATSVESGQTVGMAPARQAQPPR